MGLLTGATLGGFSGDATGSYSASYDALGRMTDTHDTLTPSGGAATPLYAVQPTYDALGNVIEMVTTLSQGVDTQVFCYDDLARLTWADSSGTPACSGAPTPSDTGSLAGTGAQYSASYSYDSLNRLTTTCAGASPITVRLAYEACRARPDTQYSAASGYTAVIGAYASSEEDSRCARRLPSSALGLLGCCSLNCWLNGAYSRSSSKIVTVAM